MVSNRLESFPTKDAHARLFKSRPPRAALTGSPASRVQQAAAHKPEAPVKEAEHAEPTELKWRISPRYTDQRIIQKAPFFSRLVQGAKGFPAPTPRPESDAFVESPRQKDLLCYRNTMGPILQEPPPAVPRRL